MNAAANVTVERVHESPFRQGAEGPAGEALRVRAYLMKTFDVHFDGLVYRCGGRRFERFTDALAHARQTACQEGPREGSGAHQRQLDSHLARQRP